MLNHHPGRSPHQSAVSRGEPYLMSGPGKSHTTPSSGYYRLGVAGIPENGPLPASSMSSDFPYTSRFREKIAELDIDDLLSSRSSTHSSRSPARSNTGASTSSSTIVTSRSGVRIGSRSPIPDKHRRGSLGSVSNSTTTSQYSTVSTIGPSVTGYGFAYNNPYSAAICPTAYHRHGFHTNEMELRKKIKNLEETVADYERQKHSVMGTFKDFRERLAEKEQLLENEYSTKIITLSEEVLAAKRDFECRMKEYHQDQERSEKDKEQALERLKQDHQKEIQVLEKRCSEANIIPDLERKYICEIQRLDEERKTLKSEKDRLTGIFESKIKRAQSLYEAELATARSLYKNELTALKDHETALRQELTGREEEFRDQLEVVHSQFNKSRAELTKCKHEVTELEDTLTRKQAEVDDIAKQLDAARVENDEAIQRLEFTEEDCKSKEQTIAEQTEQLMRKDEAINTLDNAKCRLESLIADLRVETGKMKTKIDFLQTERNNLESQSNAQAQEQETQLLLLQKMAESLSAEKQKNVEAFEQQIEGERLQNDERLYRLEKAHKEDLAKLEEQHKLYKEEMDKRVWREQETHKEQMGLEYQTQLARTEKDKSRLEAEYRSEKEDYERQLQNAQEHVVVLEAQVTEKSNYLAEISGQLDAVTETKDRVQEELEKAQSAIEELKKSVTSVDNHGQLTGMCTEECHEKLRRELEIEYKEKFEIRCSEADAAKFEVEPVQLQSRKETYTNNLLDEKLTEQQRIYEERISILESQLAEKVGILNSIEARVAAVIDEPSTSAAAADSQETILSLENTISNLREEIVGLKASPNAEDLLPEISVTNAEAHEKDETIAALNEAILTLKSMMDTSAAEKTVQIEELQAKIAEQERQMEATVTLDTTNAITAESSAPKHNLADRCESPIQELCFNAGFEETVKISELEKEVSSRDARLASAEESVQNLVREVERVNQEMEDKKLQIRKETQEYIRVREQRMNKAHKREIEKLKVQYESTLKKYVANETDLTKEVESLQKRVTDSQSDRETGSIASSDLVSEPDEMSLSKMDDVACRPRPARVCSSKSSNQIRDRKTSAVSPPSGARPTRVTRSAMSSPGGSVENFRIRNSASPLNPPDKSNYATVPSATTAELSEKWHSLVKQMQEETGSGHRSSAAGFEPRPLAFGVRKSSTGLLQPSESRQCSKSHHSAARDSSPDSKQPGQRIQHHRGSVTSSINDDRPMERESRWDNSLRLPDGRRNGTKSASRSPLPQHKLPLDKRPAWKF